MLESATNAATTVRRNGNHGIFALERSTYAHTAGTLTVSVGGNDLHGIVVLMHSQGSVTAAAPVSVTCTSGSATFAITSLMHSWVQLQGASSITLSGCTTPAYSAHNSAWLELGGGGARSMTGSPQAISLSSYWKGSFPAASVCQYGSQCP